MTRSSRRSKRVKNEDDGEEEVTEESPPQEEEKEEAEKEETTDPVKEEVEKNDDDEEEEAVAPDDSKKDYEVEAPVVDGETPADAEQGDEVPVPPAAAATEAEEMAEAVEEGKGAEDEEGGTAMETAKDGKQDDDQKQQQEETATPVDLDAVVDASEKTTTEEEEGAKKEDEDKENKEVGTKLEGPHEEGGEPPQSLDEEASVLLREEPPKPVDPKIAEEQELIRTTEATTPLELALTGSMKRKDIHIDRLTKEIRKLKSFISKRKQTYKRKRKDEGAPTRALSAYNIFVQDRFKQLTKENEEALQSTDADAQLKRVPPASLVASTGNQWKELSQEQRSYYEDKAREDRKRYEEQMAKYQPPDKQSNRKRNKTGYNMFFSAHVLRLKQSESGVPSERGSVARLVGNAWKQLSSEDKQYYEREADKQNGMNPIEKEDEEEDDESKRQQPPMPPEYQNYPPPYEHGMPPPQHMHPGQHDPRAAQHPYYHGHYMPPHGQPHYQQYDYSQQQQHPRHPGQHHQGGRSHSQHYQNYPPPQGHHYDQRGMQGM